MRGIERRDLWVRVHTAYEGKWGKLPGRWGAIRFDPEDVKDIELNRLRRSAVRRRRMFNTALRRALELPPSFGTI